MKYIIAVLMFASVQAKANPYFRLLDLGSPQISAGAFIDPTNGDSSGGTMLAIITHATKDGCYLPSVVCEDWSPLSIGFAGNNGKVIFALGPSVNLAPISKSLILKAFNLLTADGSYAGVKSALGSESLDRQDISMSFGPTWAISPTENWKGYARMFAGAAWKF